MTSQAEQRKSLNIDALLRKLEKIGATVDETTIQKWARHGIIPASVAQQPKKGKVGRRKRDGNQGGRRSLYPPEAFEEAAAAWCLVESARKRGERIPTLGTIRKTKLYAEQVLGEYSTDYFNALALQRFDYSPNPPKLPEHLAENEEVKDVLKKIANGANEIGLSKDWVLMSSDYHSHIVSYVCGRIKAAQNRDLRKPGIVLFFYKSHDAPKIIDYVLIAESASEYDGLAIVNLDLGVGELFFSINPSFVAIVGHDDD